MKEGDIHAEYPADVDDENVSERGFQSTLPGESTRLSNALALFRVTRILSKVLDENYPAASSHEISLQTIGFLSDELEAWQSSLPSHLRLQFVQDKPSTNVVGSRSPLLVSTFLVGTTKSDARPQSLAYHYVRTLIHRPAVGSSLGAKASSSVVALASSSKHIIQIIQLLDERGMSFSFCLNKNELLLLAGFGLLYQGFDLNRKGKLIQDSQRLLCSVIEILERGAAIGSAEFKQITCAMISVNRFSKGAPRMDNGNAARREPNNKTPNPYTAPKSARKQQQYTAERFAPTATSAAAKNENGSSRRNAFPDLENSSSALYCRSESQNSSSSVVSDSTHQNDRSTMVERSVSLQQDDNFETPNLDYLSFNQEPGEKTNHHFDEQENDLLIGSRPNQQLEAPYNSLYPPSDVLSAYISSPAANLDWIPDLSAMPASFADRAAPADSVLSFSEDDLTSGEELSTCDLSGEYQGFSLRNLDGFGGLTGLDSNLGL